MPTKKLFRRLTLRDGNGEVFLDRWGIGNPHIGAIFLHRMVAPDPGVELHDHPWAFITIPLSHGYQESRADSRDIDNSVHFEQRRPLRPRRMRLDECHRVVHVFGERSWSLVFAGPVRRDWGFYLKRHGGFSGHNFVDHIAYENTSEGRNRVVSMTSNYKGNGEFGGMA